MNGMVVVVVVVLVRGTHPAVVRMAIKLIVCT